MEIDLTMLNKNERLIFFKYCVVWYDDDNFEELMRVKYLEILNGKNN